MSDKVYTRKQNQVPFQYGISVNGQTPLDDRLVLDYQDLYISATNPDTATLYKKAYQGMIVSVVSKRSDDRYSTVPFVLNDASPYTPGTVKNIDSTNLKVYWTSVGSGVSSGSIPVLNEDQVNTLKSTNDVPDNYINVDSKVELDSTQNIININPENSGNLISVMFSALRELQREVLMLKNSFNYGIESMQDGETSSSHIINSIDEEAVEPLWAIDPTYLSELSDASLKLTNGDCQLLPTTGWKTSTDLNNFVNVLSTSSYDMSTYTSVVEEAKEIIYLKISTQSSEWSVSINIENFESIELNKIIPEGYSNIMIVVNRKKNTDETYDNYIWVSATDINNDVLRQGYIKNGSLVNAEYVYKKGTGQKFNILTATYNKVIIYKSSIYVKYNGYTNDDIIPKNTDLDDLRYRAAHISIRSVQKYTNMNPENSKGYFKRFFDKELLFCEEDSKLYLKYNNKLISLAGNSSSGNSGMTQEEMITWLTGQNLIKENSDGTYDLNNVFDEVTFNHTDSGKSFTFKTDAYGNLRGQEVTSITKDTGVSDLNQMTNKAAVTNYEIVNQVTGYNVSSLDSTVSASITSTIALGDRVRFGSWYIPTSTQQVFNCTHDFVELANSGSVDYPLDNTVIGFIQFVSVNGKNTAKIDMFTLSGKIKAGGTYVIRMKKHLDSDSALAHIKVDNYDIELWKNKDLYDSKNTETMILFNKCALSKFRDNTDGSNNILSIQLANFTTSKVVTWLIDAVTLGSSHDYFKSSNVNSWTNASYAKNENQIVKDMYELDPAKQAYRSLVTCSDSTNARLDKPQPEYVPIAEDNISFVNSDEKISIERYTPKSSTDNKNVITDKTQPDTDKPNFVMCSFGINGLTTRCFNWVSIGIYNEYIWYRAKGETTWNGKLASYSSTDTVSSDIYSAVTSGFGTRKAISKELMTYVYGRIIDTFPATNYTYSAHKCIIDFSAVSMDSDGKKEIEYIVGRALKDGTPDPEHVSSVNQFTLHDTTWTPFVIQHSDEQGFTWIEYQVWNAAAHEIDKKITSYMAANAKTYPVVIETGDMTQNGTRVNEWLDFYNGGKVLLSKYEHMAIVGNNDLANSTDHNALGTGDDDGKSNFFYFNVFHCYEIPEKASDFTTTYTGWLHPLIIEKTTGVGVYIPSMYYFTLGNYGYLMVNSEITTIACDILYGRTGINIYDGYNSNNKTVDSSAWTLKKFCELCITNMSGKKIIAACHEMPFTVILQSQLTTPTDIYRGGENSSKLDIISSESNYVGENSVIYDTEGFWFGKMLNDHGIKLCIGGHKHTYAVTYPIIETPWTDLNKKGLDVTIKRNNLTHNYSQDIPACQYMKFYEGTTMYEYDTTNKVFAATSSTPDSTKTFTTYFMLQATGYKLTSNKELPSRFQFFSKIVPVTIVSADGKSTPDPSQQYPMYGLISPSGDNFNIDLYRIRNTQTETAIDPTNKFDDKSGTATATSYSTNTKITALSSIKYPTKSTSSELLLISLSGDFYNNYWYVGESYPSDCHANDIQRCWGANTSTTMNIYKYSQDATTNAFSYSVSTITVENKDHTLVV
jgi:hypothetical protein